MNLLKKIFIVIAVLIILLLVLAFILPKKMHVEVTREVDAPTNVVYNIINDLKTQEHWNPWRAEDPTMTFTFPDKTSGKGASYNWTSENSGSGSQIILDNVKNEQVVAQVNFDGMGSSESTHTLVPNGDKTNITWTFEAESSVPMNLFNFLGEMQIAKSFKKGLALIEDLAVKRTKNNEYDGYVIKEETVSGRTYIMNRAEVLSENAHDYYSQSLPQLFGKIQELGLKMDGRSSILYYSFESADGKSDLAAAVPITEEVAVADADVSIETMPTDKAIVVDYYGKYAGTDKAHDAIDAYMRDRGLLKKYPIIEEFVTDPTKESDSSKWHTRIIYFIAS